MHIYKAVGSKSILGGGAQWLSLKEGAENLGIGESGNRGIRESGNPGIGDSGNRGIRELGNRGIRESRNPGIGESGKRNNFLTHENNKFRPNS
jgi:hypothetical protein